MWWGGGGREGSAQAVPRALGGFVALPSRSPARLLKPSVGKPSVPEWYKNDPRFVLVGRCPSLLHCRLAAHAEYAGVAMGGSWSRAMLLLVWLWEELALRIQTCTSHGSPSGVHVRMSPCRIAPKRGMCEHACLRRIGMAIAFQGCPLPLHCKCVGWAGGAKVCVCVCACVTNAARRSFVAKREECPSVVSSSSGASECLTLPLPPMGMTANWSS